MIERNYVTIVSGLPRSGTSMMMRMLERGGIPVLVDNQRTADPDNPNGYYEFEPVKKTKEDPSWVEGASGKVVKMVHLLLLDLPLTYQYRVVFMRRRLEEVVKSQDVMLERHGKEAADLPKARLMDVYLKQIAKVQAFMESNGGAFEFMEVDYNALLADAESQIEPVSDFLDGLDTTAMKSVVDQSLYRNRVH